MVMATPSIVGAGMISAFGVDHGDSVSKADYKKEKRAAAVGAGIGAAGGATNIYGASARKFATISNNRVNSSIEIARQFTPDFAAAPEYKKVMRTAKGNIAAMHHKALKISRVGRAGMLTGGVVAGGAGISAVKRKYGK